MASRQGVALVHFRGIWSAATLRIVRHSTWKGNMPNMNSDDDTQESSSDEEVLLSATPYETHSRHLHASRVMEEAVEVVVLTGIAVSMPKRRRSHSWSQRKHHGAPAPRPRGHRPQPPRDESSVNDESSVVVNDSPARRQTTWASELFEDASMRTWFLGLSQEEQALVQLPTRSRRRCSVLNVSSTKGKFMETGSSSASDNHEELGTSVVHYEEQPAQEEDVPRRENVAIVLDDHDDEPMPRSANVSWRAQPKPVASPPKAPHDHQPAPVAPSANASWRRPQPKPAASSPKAPHDHQPAPGSYNASWRRPQPMPVAPLTKLDLPDFLKPNAATTAQHKWPVASAPEHSRVVDHDAVKRMLANLKPASYTSFGWQT